jgi:ketosteroid isomerase-like protein
LRAAHGIIVPVAAQTKAKTGFSMENERCFLFRVKGGRIVYGRIWPVRQEGAICWRI